MIDAPPAAGTPKRIDPPASGAPVPAAATKLLVEHATVRGMRTWDRLELDLATGIVVILGPNGSGKTNLLEAVATTLTGTSPRTHTELRLVSHSAPCARIVLGTSIGDARSTRVVTIDRIHGKQLEVDGSRVRSLAQFAASAPAVTFLPERLLVLRGAPARRRALLDRIVERLIPTATASATAYAHAVQQRNVLLRRARASGQLPTASIEPWNAQAVEHGTLVRQHRAQVVRLLQKPWRQRFFELTGLSGGAVQIEQRGEDLATSLAATLPVDVRRGSTTTGPHHDEVVTSQEGRDLKAWGSTGEQRAALLAWSLAEADLIESELGVLPVLLLDEPWAELDASRRRMLTQTLTSYGQVIVTSTEPPAHLTELAPAAQLLRVSSGQIEPWTTASPDPVTPPP